jgi:hypothetical protein
MTNRFEASFIENINVDSILFEMIGAIEISI